MSICIFAMSAWSGYFGDLKVADWLVVVGIVVALAAWLIDRALVYGFFRKQKFVILVVVVVIVLAELWQHGCFNWLFIRSNWPVWAIILLPVACVSVVVLVIFWGALAKRQASPDPTQYCHEIDGITWVWQWMYGKIDNDSLAPFCPKPYCKAPLQFRFNEHSRSFSLATMPCSLVCERCGFKKDYEISEGNVKKHACLEIISNLNTGMWLNRLNQKRRVD